ncbi:MAG: 3-deoxy-7-phosphoheptulonate synthase [bacterium]
MFLTLKKEATKSDIDKVVKKVKELGFTPHLSKGAEVTVIGVIGENAIVTREIFESFETVISVTPISRPFKLVSREFKKENTEITVPCGEGKMVIGGKGVAVIAGPCSVETKDRLIKIAQTIKESGACMLRGGAFKPRTSPYAFQGLGERGLKYLADSRKLTNLPIVTEVMNINQIKLVEKYTDIMQIGARNVQNFDLLKEAGKVKKPILLKRGLSTTVKELLMSAEYILANGNYNVILCERGIRTFEDSTRFTLDLNAVPVMKKLSHLPVFVDPSHGVGVREFVPAMAKAAVAAGADGLLIEVHPVPEEAFSDGAQSLLPDQFKQMMVEIEPLIKLLGRELIKVD